MTADKDRIRTGKRREVSIKKVTHQNLNPWCSQSTGILLDDGLALRTNLKAADLKMRELQTGFDGHTTRTEADIPEHASLRKFESLKGQQSDGHLRDHLLTTIKQLEIGIGDAKGAMRFHGCAIGHQYHTIGHQKITTGSLLECERRHSF